MIDGETGQEVISLRQILGVVRRNGVAVVILVLLTVGLSLLAVEYLPQKYKSKAVLSIQSSYFQHPLVSNLISEVHDPSELSAQRLSLLRLALNDDFLDEMGQKYQLFSHAADSPMRTLDREGLFKSIEYFSINPTSFQISIQAGNPRTAYSMTKDVLSQMTFTLIEQRFQTLRQARGAVLKQAKLLNSTLVDRGSASQLRLDALQNKLSVMEENLSTLRARFTENHPDVLSAKSKAQALKNQIKSLPQQKQESMTKPVDDYTGVFLSPVSNASTEQIFDDLLKKLNNLNIVLEMEKDRSNVSYLAVIEQPTIPIQPFFPDRIRFTLFGLLGGLVLGGVKVTFSELRRAAKLFPAQAASEFGLELLGELPPFVDAGESLLMLDGSSRRLIALPNSPQEK